MKRLFLILINLLSFASPSFAMNLMDEPLVELGHGKMLLVKTPEDFRSQNPEYQGISALYSDAQCPKIPIVRLYTHTDVTVPFAASLPNAHAPKSLENIYGQHLSAYTKVYSFIVQSIADEKKDGIEHLHALKTHYFVHPNAPRYYEGRDFTTQLRWTAVPGVRGYVEPEEGGLQTADLLSNSAWTHPHSSGVMVVSGDVMHLRGIYHRKSVDMSSLVAFTDEQGHNIAAITYHWLLNKQDEDMFWDVILNNKTQTFRDLINDLEPIENFRDLLNELKRYEGLTDSKVELRELEEFLRQQDYPHTYRMIKDSGNKTSDEEIVKYVLEKNGGYTSWDKLTLLDKRDIVKTFINCRQSSFLDKHTM